MKRHTVILSGAERSRRIPSWALRADITGSLDFARDDRGGFASTLTRASMLFCVMLLFSTAMQTVFAQQSDAVAKANEAYNAGLFPQAVEFYSSAITAGQTNAPTFYNLGNAFFRTGELGHAILNYERALALEPQYPEAQANLLLARDKARALELRRYWWDHPIARLSPASSAVVAASAFWIALFALAALILSRRRSRALSAIFVLALLLCAAAVTALYLAENGNHGRALAIVTAKDIQARLATADSAGAVLALPAGSEIRILSTRGDWAYAALPNELRGWIPASSAERVWR